MSTNENGEEVIVEDVDESIDVDTTTESTIDWEAKAKEYEGRLKRAETKLKKSSEKLAESKPSTSNGLDYGMKALLRSEGIKGEAETKLVQEYMRETGKDIESVLDSKHFKAELEDLRELAKSAAATPAGKGSNNSSIDSVEYWMTKDIADVPKEMRIQVVNARLKQEKSGGVFYNS